MTSSSSRPPLFWTLQAGGWLLYAIAFSLGRVSERAPAPVIAATEWVNAALAFAITLGLDWVYRRAGRAGEHRHGRSVRGAAVSAAALAGGAALWTVVFRWYLLGPAAAVVAALGGATPHPGDGWLDTGGTLVGTAMHRSVPLLAWSAAYFALRHHGALQAARARPLRAEADAQRAQLRALRYQLDPHFLFNTLNAVSTRVVEGRARAATGMLARLADFLRLALAHDGAPEVPLAQELDFVRRYLAIEQVRFGDRLRVDVDVPDAALAVPALILQPLIENAIRHAITPRTEGGHISVAVRLEPGAQGGPLGETLAVSVCDDGPGIDDPALDGPGLGLGAPSNARGDRPRGAPRTGVGLANTRERLRHLYGDAYGLELGAAAGGGLCARVRVPVPAAPA